MKHLPSAKDRVFVHQFESGLIAPELFSHREHLRMAYVMLADQPLEEAHSRARIAIKSLLVRNGIDVTNYHETLTVAWLEAVSRFMRMAQVPFRCADEFLQEYPQLLDSNIMLSHYSRETLFSDEARNAHVRPDREPII